MTPKHCKEAWIIVVVVGMETSRTLSPRLEYSEGHILKLTPDQVQSLNRIRRRLEDGTYATEERPCFCGARQGLLLGKRDRYGLPVTTVLCHRCGLLRTDPVMTGESTERFYEEEYRQLYSGHEDPTAALETQVGHGEELLALLGPLLGEVQVVYEVGCGAGGILLPFARAGMEVAGCDLGQEHLEEGRSRGLPLVVGDVDALLSSRNKPADLLIMNHVLEHFRDLKSELRRVMSAIRPGGLLVVDVPGIFNIVDRYRSDLLLYLQNAHNFHFSARTLSFVLRAAGLQVLAVDERAMAIARRPPVETRPAPVAPPRGEAMKIMRFLGGLERKLAA